MVQISNDKLIIGASLIFFVGIFVFAIIFKALALIGSVEESISVLVGNDPTSIAYYVEVFRILPWILGFLYIVFVGGIIYVVVSKGKKEDEPQEVGLFGETPKTVNESFEDIFYKN
ncbi:MAG: hypothetical protein PHT91_02490 [Candidatus Nanoarchaeia archaeon]|nr:hypothetical protein [Candidatus Nanoarchaeia archaeon]MDD5053905.1 hypothetical protein [Candidatus Nanoarchaeia archaeon]MDD5499720.1 hypothetical protein [Candidatus Nanoarchaeia archaeon]